MAQNQAVHIPAKADDGLRAMLTLAGADRPLRTDQLAAGQALPPRFLGTILGELPRPVECLSAEPDAWALR